MNYRNIERAITDGYELIVDRDNLSPRFHARVTMRTPASGHHNMGMTVSEALRGLDNYLEHVRPDSANASQD